jgi:hypothetical protein
MPSLFHTLERIERKIDTMAITEAQFDQDLGPFLTAVTNLIAAATTAGQQVEAYITAAQAALAAAGSPVDLTNEDNEVKTAQSAVATAASELAAAAAAIPTPPGVTPPSVTPATT